MGGRPRSAGIYPIPHWWQHPGFKSSYIREFVRFGGFACCFFRGRGRPLCLWMESAWPVGCLVDGTQGGWWFSHGSCGGLTLFLHPVGGIRLERSASPIAFRSTFLLVYGRTICLLRGSIHDTRCAPNRTFYKNNPIMWEVERGKSWSLDSWVGGSPGYFVPIHLWDTLWGGRAGQVFSCVVVV